MLKYAFQSQRDAWGLMRGLVGSGLFLAGRTDGRRLEMTGIQNLIVTTFVFQSTVKKQRYMALVWSIV